MKKKQEGVWLADRGPQGSSGIVHLTEHDIAFIEGEAPHTEKLRARICAHEYTDRAHLMLIAFSMGSTNPMHFHHKPESMLVISGCMSVQIEDGELHILYPQHFLRVPAGVRHQPIPVTDCVVLEIAEK